MANPRVQSGESRSPRFKCLMLTSGIIAPSVGTKMETSLKNLTETTINESIAI